MTPPTPLRLHDSLKRQTVPFEPLEPGKVGMYVCGPTTYAPAHIGHAFSAISFDTIRRGLRFLGYQVRYVRNVTDVDDKIINRANETGEDPVKLAARFADEYNRDMARFGVLPPDIEPRVSGHIPQIIAITERLVANGKAYAVDGDVYYQVDTFPAYGKLSGMDLGKLREGARVEVDRRKRDPADFALWKSAKPGEPSWDSPWGKGRPGWHIECSAMTVTHLGATFDIHGGGKDLIFPHHENEIAQSQGADGEGTFARYWLHNGFLNFGGVKMSKSLGNVFNCEQIAEVVGGEALRFFCVQHHYQSPVEFEVEHVHDAAGEITGVIFRSLEAADRRLSYFYETLHRIDLLLAAMDFGSGAVLAEAEGLVADTRTALADNFNTPVVIAAMEKAASVANRLIDQPKGLDKQLRLRTLARIARDLRATGEALGIYGTAPAAYLAARRDRLVKRHAIDVAAVDRLIVERATARASKDFTRADAVRDELLARRVGVIDTPQGTTWRVLDEAG
ncbi:MAG: cysteine--tRNA ligase [Deltaproteobacteria bacterium]|nr:cysteine--tRNA ligase [Deltaproteobacteria bacterium]